MERTRTGEVSALTPRLDAVEDREVAVLFRTFSTRADVAKPLERVPTREAADAVTDVHLLGLPELFVKYSTEPNLGLSADAVARQAGMGKNVLSPPKTNHFKKVMGYLFGGFNSLMWIAAILAFVSYKPLGDPNPQVLNLGVGVLLLLVISVSTFFYAYVDYNASKIMKSIQGLVAQKATVIRNGQEENIESNELVVGDIVVLSIGQRVPADIRLFEVSSDLQFDRSLLTGESVYVPGTVTFTDGNPLETRNLALSSTFVVRGRAKGVVYQIGDNTVIGQILKMSGKQETPMTPIQREIQFFVIIISSVAVSFFILALILWYTWIRVTYPGYETLSVAIINSIGCLTAFVPIGLPVCFALALTIIARRMAERKVLVKNLSTIETLGCMSVLCSDKTGTLTLGKMFVQSALFIDQVLAAPKPDGKVEGSMKDSRGLQWIHFVASLCNDARFLSGSEDLPPHQRTVNGDSTDSAILIYAEQLQEVFPTLTEYNVLFTMAFNSKNKFMAKIVQKEGETPLLLMKGAPDILMKSCAGVMASDGKRLLLSEDGNLQKIEKLQEEYSSKGLRVLSLCKKDLSGIALPVDNQEDMEKLIMEEMEGLDLVGMVGLCDPPRSDTLDTVKTIRAAGVRVFMVTGDFELTAMAIAKQVGIMTAEKSYRLRDLDQLKIDYPLKDNYALHDLRPQEEDGIRAITINGAELESMTEYDWDFCATRFNEMVFARTTPEQKLLIIENLKARGDNVVAVTGDGTNDAPALKAADIGVAMGGGSDVAKEAAVMILLNNDFSSILIGIENGRLVFENLKKVLLYLMPAGSYAEFMAVVSNVFFGMQLPLSSFLQVIYCVANDVMMSLSLMYEKAESDVMRRPPRNARTDRLTDWRFFAHVFLGVGACVWLSAMGMWFLYMSEQGISFNQLMLVFDKWADGWAGQPLNTLNNDVNVGQSVFYITLGITQFGTLLACRTRTVSILQSNPFSFKGAHRNWVIPMSMAGSILISIIVIYGPGIESVFGTAIIPTKYWFLPFAFALGIVLIEESRKAVVRAYPKSFLAWLAW